MMFADWIKTPGMDRCYLVEFQVRQAGQVNTIRRSTHPYRSSPTDTPAFTPYHDTVLSVGSWGRELTELFTGYSTTARTSIDLFLDEELQALLETASVGGLPVTIRCGDASWPLAQFGVVITATAEALRATSYDTVQLTLRDTSELLRRQLQTTLIASGPNAGQPVPICLGRCFNVSPVLLNDATKTYQVHDGAIQAITAVRENGVAIPYTANLAAGTFTLTNNAKGRVTADVDGAKPAGTWLQNAAQMITYLVGRFGLAVPAGLATLPAYQLGLYITGDKALATALDDISASVGAAWYYSRLGQLQWLFFNGPGAPVASVTSDDIEDNSLWPRRRIAPAKTVKIGYRRNWTPQADGLAGSVRETTPAVAATYEQSESSFTATNAGIDDPDAVDVSVSTLIVTLADATTEANRRAAWSAVPRTIFECSAFAAPFNLDLGQTVTIEYPQYFAVPGQAVITRLRDELLQDTCTLEVIR
jgi:hypothetical protein